MAIHRPFLALVHGIKLTVFDSAVRRLAFWPWVAGLFGYIASIYAAYKLHNPLLLLVVSPPGGIWSTILYWLAWLLVSAIMIVASFLLSITFVMLFTAVFQTAIAQAALRSSGAGREFPEISLVGDTVRTIAVETKKLFWLLPLGVILFVVGFIPLLTPFALVLGAWLLAYSFVDVVLDVFHLGARARFGFARRNFLVLVSFGLTLMAAWAVPFLGIFLAPAATAAAAWLLADEKFIKQIDVLAAKNPAPPEPC